MSEEAKKKVATAAQQAKHAAANVEKATELEVEEAVQTISQLAEPIKVPTMKVATGVVIFCSGVGAYHLAQVTKTRVLNPWRQKRAEKKAAQTTEVLNNEEALEGTIVDPVNIRHGRAS